MGQLLKFPLAIFKNVFRWLLDQPSSSKLMNNTSVTKDISTSDTPIVFKTGKLVYFQTVVDAILTNSCLLLKYGQQEVIIHLSDVFSVELHEEIYFSIYCFSMASEKRTVQRFFTTVPQDSFDWVSKIREQAFKIVGPLKIRRIYILINPNSGGKTAFHTFQEHCKPILDFAHISYKVQLSKHCGHITELMKSVNLDDFDEFIAVGGDGTLFELLQGLLNRPDWEKVSLEKCIGVIPCGSGNGLATSLGSFNASQAAFIIARGFSKKLDIASVYQHNRRYFLFLSISWGIVADVDLGADFLRWMGPARVGLTALKCILENKEYEGIIQYVEDSSSISNDSKTSNFDQRKKQSESFPSRQQLKDEIEKMKEVTNQMVESNERLSSPHYSD